MHKKCPQSSDAEVLECLYNLKPADVATVLPIAYLAAPTLPEAPGGQNYVGMCMHACGLCFVFDAGQGCLSSTA